jgi:hypothetical protein
VDREILGGALSVPVEVPERVPVAELGIAGETEDIEARYAPALGVAWQEIADKPERVNLVQPRTERHRLARRYRKVKMVAAGSALAFLAVLAPVLGLLVLRAQLRITERQLQAIAPEVAELKGIEQQMALLRPWTTAKERPLQVLEGLTQPATQDFYIEAVSVTKDGRLTVRGLAKSEEVVGELVNKLAGKTALFSEVTRGSTSRAADAGFGYQFTVLARVPRWAGESTQGGR